MSSIRYFAGLLVAAFVVSGCNCRPPPPPSSFGEIAVVVKNGETETSGPDGEYNFENVPMGTSKRLRLVIRNNGRGALDLRQIEKVSGANLKGDMVNEDAPVFEVAFSPQSLGTGEEAAYDIAFNAPVEADPMVVTKAWEVIIKLNADNTAEGMGSSTITLKGNAVAGSCVLPTQIDFGSVQVNDTVKATIPVNNTSVDDAIADIGQITSSSGDNLAFGFATESITGTPLIPAGSSREIVLTFKPTQTTDYLAILKAKAAAQCPEVNIKLIGSGVNSVLTCDRDRGPNDPATPLDFGYVTPTLTVQKELVLTNQGITPIQLSNVVARANSSTLSPDYKVVGPNAVTVPGAMMVNGVMTPGTLRLPITFTPIGLGLRNASLVATTSLSQQMNLSCPLRGQGGGPDIDVKPATLNIGRVPYFEMAVTPFFVSRKVTVQNLGTPPSVATDVNGNLRLMKPTFMPMNADSTMGELCVGTFDEMTQTCIGELPSSYDAATGLVARAGLNSLDVPVRITPNAPNKNYEYEVTFP
ncbi:MAG: choice-of-anchor D domain-containing protein, partial [Myxococcaceae bacterium]|nr:choice-of-anchor D domain-containing protein [Myxococcaceae bacterium]